MGPVCHHGYSLRAHLLQELHEGHIGIVKMKALARSYIWWPNMDADIEKIAARCEECGMTANVTQPSLCHPWQHTHTPWDRIHVDF